MVQTREEFKEWIDRNFDGVSVEPDSPLWIPEHDLQSTLCGWFVTVKPLKLNDTGLKAGYYSWCRENLSGYTRCFYSDTDSQHECWGFTNYDDIVLWLLKYAK